MRANRTMRYDEAVESLFQAPHEQFVAERKRLAAELKAGGDRDGAARVAKLGRPPISAWVVDQLWWQARDAFDALFETAERVRRGDLGASTAHRESIAKLRARAAQILDAAQHGASEATLRRVTQTLSALAAAGSWSPDPPGALSADRDPPGFDAIGLPAERAAPATPAPARPAALAAAAAAAAAAATARAQREADELARQEREAAAARAEAAAEQRRIDAARARAAAERQRLEAALRTAQGDVVQREREVARLERDLAHARDRVEQARAVVTDLEMRLAAVES